MSLTQRFRGGLIRRAYHPWLQPGARVLDVGCGNGEVSRILRAEGGVELWGTDILDYRQHEFPFRLMADPVSLPFEENSFDLVLFNDILHHAEQVESLLREGMRVAPVVLIFEDVESVTLKAIDLLLNHFYCADMPCPLNFRTAQQWGELFEQLGVRWQEGRVETPFWYPVGHMAFRLERKSA